MRFCCRLVCLCLLISFFGCSVCFNAPSGFPTAQRNVEQFNFNGLKCPPSSLMSNVLNLRCGASSKSIQHSVLKASVQNEESNSASKVESAALTQKLKVGLYLALWYIISIGYNLDTKKIFNMMPLPWTLMSVQLCVGSFYVVSLWLSGLRKSPKLTKEDMKSFAPVAFLNMLSLLTAAIGLGAGTVSFVHIVKSAEPLFTSLFGALILKQFMAPQVYASLLPVIAGVSLASIKELSFSWTAMGGAMGSNLTSALRAVMAKKTLGGKNMSDKNMGGANLYGVLTVMGCLMLIPGALLVEGEVVSATWKAAIAAGHSVKDIILPTLRSGLYLYWYYEVSFLALDAISPVTHAIANTMRRVFLVASSIIVFNTPVTAMNIFGSFLAIGGVFVYSIVKGIYDKKQKE